MKLLDLIIKDEDTERYDRALGRLGNPAIAFVRIDLFAVGRHVPLHHGARAVRYGRTAPCGNAGSATASYCRSKNI
jgi:hypothetical protein